MQYTGSIPWRLKQEAEATLARIERQLSEQRQAEALASHNIGVLSQARDEIRQELRKLGKN